jgi:hypothetical protein
MYLPVSHYHQYIVHILFTLSSCTSLFLACSDNIELFLYERGEVGGSTQRDRGERLFIELEHVGRAVDVRRGGQSVQGEGVGHPRRSKEAGDAAEAENWEGPVVIIDLEDRAY